MTSRRRTPWHPPIPLPAGLPSVHALLAPAVAHAFDALKVGAVLREDEEWYPLHVPEPSVLGFELQHGKEHERGAYNERCTRQARETGTIVRGSHTGFSDFFVPIGTERSAYAVLVTGPFATARPTSTDLIDRWRWLTGRTGRISDPEFARYVAMTLGTLTLDAVELECFERLLQCFAALCAGSGDPRALAAEASALRSKVEGARSVDWVWEQVRTMVDERSERVWSSSYKVNDLSNLGLDRLPEHALVGLVLGRRDESDHVAEMLAKDAFQRDCVELARSQKNVVAGRVGEHGVVFLIASDQSPVRLRQQLRRVGERASELARRRHGLGLYLGASVSNERATLSVRYELALAAAETALSQGQELVYAEPNVDRTVSPLRRLREQLGAVTEERPEVLVNRFERYVDAVIAHSGHRSEIVHAHLDAGFERAAQAIRAIGAVEERGRLDLYEAIDRAARDARTVDELVMAYRHAVADLVDAAEHPVPAGRERGVRRALAFMEEHLAERLTLARVARATGFAPRYFSRLFKKREGVGFEVHLKTLRIERAKRLLGDTDLSVERIADMCGFATRPHMHRVFKELVGATPVEFRASKR